MIVATPHGYVSARVVVNCAGLHSDRVANLADADATDVRIMPFRGEYYKLRPQRRHLVNNLIYPVPDPRFPFLGVHFTRMVGGGVEAGPNAVPALAREGYSWRDVRLDELGELRPVAVPAGRSCGATGAPSWASSTAPRRRPPSSGRCSDWCPKYRADDLVRGGAGVRAQAIAPDGSLLDDFAVTTTPRLVHVVNAPSPAATASLAIGRHVAALALDRL